MTYSPDEHTLPVRQEVLLEGIDDWVELGTVHRYVAHENAGEDVSVIQTKVLELIRELASEGLYEIGDQLRVNGGRFGAWDMSVDEAIERIRETYVGQFDDPFQWEYMCSLSLTDNGMQVAEALGHEVGYFTPPLTADEIRAEHQRLASAASLVGIVAGCVDDFRHINAEEASELAGLSIPTGWQRVNFSDAGEHPSRTVVYERYPDGRWNACEATALFGFTGCPPEQVVYDNSDCALRDLTAPLGDGLSFLADLKTEVLTTPEQSGVIAVRSTGSFVFCQRWMYARYYTYIACSPEPGHSRMLQQVLIFDSTLEEPLATDLTSLTDTARDAFIAATTTP